MSSFGNFPIVYNLALPKEQLLKLELSWLNANEIYLFPTYEALQKRALKTTQYTAVGHDAAPRKSGNKQNKNKRKIKKHADSQNSMNKRSKISVTSNDNASEKRNSSNVNPHPHVRVKWTDEDVGRLTPFT